MLELIRTMLPAAMGDALTAQQVVYAGTAAAALQYSLQTLVPNRLRKTADIWIQEVGKILEDLSAPDQREELASIVDCFLQIGRKGTAEANLRLLARIVAGQKAHGALRADEFLCYADILASLRHEEIVLLGTLHRFLKEEIGRENPKTPEHKAQERAKQKLVAASVFISEEDFQATLGALMRTGLVIAMNTWGGPTYKTSPLMDRLVYLPRLKIWCEIQLLNSPYSRCHKL